MMAAFGILITVLVRFTLDKEKKRPAATVG